jgi:predicted ATPase
VPPPEWRDMSFAYERTVFVAPPWRDIYVQDAERPQTFDEARSLGEHVRQAYVDCGFTIVDLVAGTVKERLLQVCRHLATIPVTSPAPFARFA